MYNNKEFESKLNTLMDVENFDDYGPNGLQVEGKPDIRKITISTSISIEVIKGAISNASDAILVHHGLFWKNTSPIIIGPMKERMSLLLENNINVYAYHLPMDFLPLYGNNHPVISFLGVNDPEPFQNIGYKGDMSDEQSVDTFIEKIESYYKGFGGKSGNHVHPKSSKKTIKKICIVSGGGQSYFADAIAEGVDAFITGEQSEWVYNMARENNVLFCAMGHYVTEMVGPNLLGQMLQDKWGLDVSYCFENNPF